MRRGVRWAWRGERRGGRSRAFSSDHSFEATPEISSSFSRCPSRFIPITEVSVVESVGLNG